MKYLPNKVQKSRPHKVCRLAGYAGNQHGLLPVLQHGLLNAQNMLFCLPRSANHLGNTLADAAVHADLGVVAGFLNRLHLKLHCIIFRRDLVRCDLLKQFTQFRFILN